MYFTLVAHLTLNIKQIYTHIGFYEDGRTDIVGRHQNKIKTKVQTNKTRNM